MGRVEARLFTLQLSVLISAGIPILPSLHAMAKADSPGLGHAADFLASRLASGWSLSKSMQDLPDAFDKATIGLVTVGESTGKLHSVLNEATQRNERLLKSGQKLQAALVYPAVVVLVAVVMLIFMAGYLLPRFLVIFESFDLEMPLPTRIIMGLTKLQVPLFFVGLLMVAGVMAMLGGKHPKAIALRTYLLYDTPGLGGYNRSTMLSDLSLDLSLMLTAGLNLTEALRLCRASVGDHRLAEALDRIRQQMVDGEDFLNALAGQDRLPPVFVSTIKAGADSGELPRLLTCLGRLTAEDADFQREHLSSLLEVFMLAFMGLVVGFVLLACFLPIYKVVGSGF
jgi:type IV pilus assembly protein PilC